MVTKKTTKKWMPTNEVTRNGEAYVYIGDTIRSLMDYQKTFNTEQGRKTVFVNDKNDKENVCVYASKKFYPKTCKTIYPAFGKGTLVRRPTW